MKLSPSIASVFARLGAALPVMAVDAIGLAGCGLIVIGIWQIYAPASFVIAGLMLLAGAWLIARR